MILPLPKLRILCVDDHRDAADSCAILLELYGCDVAVCYDAEAAFAVALQIKPNICLIDLNMPGAGGCELASRLRGFFNHSLLCLIAITAYGSESARRATREAGFDHHFVKPVDWEMLMEIIAATERKLGLGGYISSGVSQLMDEDEPAVREKPGKKSPITQSRFESSTALDTRQADPEDSE